jgi:hypothetical protein
MKILQLLLFFLLTVTSNAEDESYVLTLADAPATLSNGIPFTMEKGDCYPLVGFDASKTRAQLKLGNLTFWARTTNLASVPEADVPEAAAKYVADATKFLAEVAADTHREQEEQQAIAAERALESRRARQRRNTSDQDTQQRQPAQAVSPNAYGLGVNSDEFGRPHTYRTRDGERLSPIFQGDVKRDAYGLGVHSDQFGRPVYDSKP